MGQQVRLIIKNTTYNNLGYSMIELMIAVCVIGLLAMTAKASYSSYIDKTELNLAIKDIKIIEFMIKDYKLTNGFYPESLSQIQVSMLDPWDNPYQYLALEGIKKGKGNSRKDHSLVPINSDFDLYSSGKDGRSVAPLTAKHSRDDIVRASNGKFIGLASDF